MGPTGAPVPAAHERHDPAPAGNRRITTVLFSDLVGFSTLAEELDPEIVRAVQDHYFRAARTAIERHGGTVEKYIGDAVMAVFGLPAVREDDALRAVRAALDVHAAIADVGRAIPAIGPGRLTLRSGINTGEIVAHGEPSDGSLVTGDAVNVAARLQQAADPGSILASASTYALVRHAVEVEPVGQIRVKGRTAPVEAYRVVAVLAEAEAVARRQDGSFVGRGRELTVLESVLDRVVGDRSVGAVTLIGAPGVGKSRLVHEFLGHARKRARVLRGRCLPYGDGITWWPLVEVLHAAANVSAADDPSMVRQKLRQTIGDIEHADLVDRRIATLIGASEEPAPAQELAWAVRRLLERIARDPLVLVIDDVQWGEEPLLDLLEHTVDRLVAPAMLVFIARPELSEIRPGWLDGRAFAERLRVEPLDPAVMSTLLDGLLENVTLPAGPRTRILDGADGNPLFLEQMLAMLVDDGALQLGPDGLQLAGDLTALPIPPTIGALLGARLERLTGDERATIERAAVVGKVFWWGSVVELTPEAERPAVGGHLATLVRREFIRPDPVGPDATIFPGDDAFRFRHLLVRDAAYVRLSKAARAELHERFATWLEGHADGIEYAAIIGYHLEQAVGYRRELGLDADGAGSLQLRAAAYLGRAGTAALERGEVGPAVSLLGRAVDLWPTRAPERRPHLWGLAHALLLSGRVTQSEDRLRDLLGIAEAEGDERWAWSVRVRQATRAHVHGEAGSAATLEQSARAAIAAADRLDHPGLAAHALEALGMLAVQRGEVSEEDRLLHEALDLARRAGDRQREGILASTLVNRAPAGLRPVPSGITLVRDVLDAPDTGLELRANSLVALGMLHNFEDRPAEARRALAEARRIAEDLGLLMPTLAADWPWAASMVERWHGDIALAESHLRRAAELQRSANDQWHLAATAPLLADMIVLQPALLTEQRRTEARRLIEEGRDMTPAEDTVGEAGWKTILARLESAEGRHAVARQLATEAVAAIDRTEEIWFAAEVRLVLAAVARAAGDHDGVRVAALQAVELARRKQAPLYEHAAAEYLD